MQTLRECRIEKLLGVRELARLAGVGHRTIIQIEHGRQTPTLPTIRKISHALDTDPHNITEFHDAIEAMTTT